MVEQHQKVYWQVHALVNTHTKIHCLHRTCQWFQIFLSSIFLLTSLWSWFCMYIIGLFFILSVWAWNTLKCSAIPVFIWWFLSLCGKGRLILLVKLKKNIQFAAIFQMFSQIPPDFLSSYLTSYTNHNGLLFSQICLTIRLN